ncbi:succinate dehydrogenase cytochrome b560 subunit [Halteromyces radiatus]|uniref:succinate dehydrogenase cytochrome b560 subunit n=1 Tax=Halteromyces radiatus TaxID=101107 RepID=UPI0022207B80|nr:succinate dehydrogenase cytochrome b560 subunit [Halteromyces radiatus]KAI8098452.1 succinate dehydrogenase cytochrome b560 subunit [Halteromyces radiatus]
MLATRSILKTVAQNHTASKVVFKNIAAAPMGVRHFNVSPISKAQSPDAESELLRQQRKVRPVSPHLTIYQPQLTWYMSGLHRVTGAAVGGAFYLAAMGYLAAPSLGITVDTASMVSAAAAAPVAAKVLAKVTVATPFVFHCLNGIRHLAWDATKFLNIKDVYKTGYAVIGGTVVGTLYLASL